MRSTDERMNEVLGRVRVQESALRRKRQRIAALAGGALSVIVVVAVGMGVSSLEGANATSSIATVGLMGSVFADGSALGYIVVGLLGLVLGIVVTVLVCRFGRRRVSAYAPAADGSTCAPTADGPTCAPTVSPAADSPTAKQSVSASADSPSADGLSAEEGRKS